MKLIIVISTFLLFSCAGSQNMLTDKSNTPDSTPEISSVDINNSSVTDLTTEIRKLPNVIVRGLGPRASVFLRNQSCKPMLLLNGAIIQDYYTLYYAVNNKTVESIKVILPRQAVIYGLRSPSGVLSITTESNSSSAE